MRVRRRRVLSRDSTTLIVYYRMIAPRHTTECGLVDFASPLYTLYRRRPTLETPLFRIDPFNLTGPVSSPHAGLNCARGKAFSSFAIFRERDSFSRSRDTFVNTIDLYPPVIILGASSRLRINHLLSVASIAIVEKLLSARTKYRVCRLRCRLIFLPKSKVFYFFNRFSPVSSIFYI